MHIYTKVETVGSIALPIPLRAEPRTSFIPQIKYVLDIIIIFCCENAITSGDEDIIDESSFEKIAESDTCKIAAMQNIEKNFYAVQFHPEVNHTVNGSRVIANFVLNVCKCSGSWKMDTFTKTTIESLKEKMGDKLMYSIIHMLLSDKKGGEIFVFY